MSNETARQYDLSEIGRRIAAEVLNQLLINGVEKMLGHPSVPNQMLSKVTLEELEDVKQEIQSIIAEQRRKAQWYAELAAREHQREAYRQRVDLSIVVGEAFRGWKIVRLPDN